MGKKKVVSHQTKQKLHTLANKKKVAFMFCLFFFFSYKPIRVSVQHMR